MGNILHPTALILILYWAIGFYAFHAGAFIHILLGMAAIAIVLRIIVGNRVLVQ
ncbi:MAG: lmo0937 family membrane protein [Bacteroidales bacterium]